MENLQLKIIELRDVVDDERVSIINTCINPTFKKIQILEVYCKQYPFQ